MQDEAAREASRRQGDTLARLRTALKNNRLAIITGAGVTLNVTAEISGKPLSRITWTGLIRNGLDYLVHEGDVDKDNRRANRAHDALEDPAVDGRLEAASIMSSLMEEHDQFPTWLESVFGSLGREIRHPALLDVLKALHESGAILLTTNYDDVLEKHCGIQRVGRSNQDDVLRFRRGELTGVFHIHGSYHDADEVVLDTTGYYKLKSSDVVQDMLRTFLQDKTILFVGCGSGLEDPNFDVLLRWASEGPKCIPKRHYLLIRDDETATYRSLTKVIKVKYGPRYEDLVMYLGRLLDDGTEMQSLLYQAILERNTPMVNDLLQRGANPNAKMNNGPAGWTALHEAAKKGTVDIAELLLKKKANPNAKAQPREQPGWTVLREAVKRGDIDMIQLLLANEADPNLGADDGWTPLHEAAYYSNRSIAELLLKSGAESNAKRGSDEWTVLCEAIEKVSLSIVRLLLSKGAVIRNKERDEARRKKDGSFMDRVDSSTRTAPTGLSIIEQPSHISNDPCATDAWIRRFKDLVKSKLTSKSIDDNRLKVAILDSGIDMGNTDIDAQSDRIKSIRSWVDGKTGVEAKRDGDLSGHGTHIAGIILDLAPNVDIYIARVTKTRKFDSTEQISKAINYSWKTWEVDMITMSFGFQEVIPQVQKEIEEAVHNGKIVFAAASNDGGNSPRNFPASEPRVICVHSTDSHGNPSAYNPTAKTDRHNFSILGQCINSCWPDANVAGASRRMTGTSIATPVAVALAAFIIGYIQQEIPIPGTPIEPKSYRGMVSLFKLFMMSNGGPRGKYDLIAPFAFFEFAPGKIREDVREALKKA